MPSVPITSLVTDSATEDVVTVTPDIVGFAVDAETTFSIFPTKSFKKLVIRITNTTIADVDFTILAGDSPPALSAGQGNYVVPMGSATIGATTKFVSLGSARFIQDDGSIRISIDPSTTGFVAAFQLI